MPRFVFLLIVLAYSCKSEDLPNLGVIGGGVASHGQFPYTASIELDGRQHCGGTIIALNRILTAAHCVVQIQPSRLTILAGTNNRLNGGMRAKVHSYIAHESYDPNSKAYDIAIINLEGVLTQSRTIDAAELPAQSEQLYNNGIATISGWGTEFHQGPTTTSLKYAQIPLWSIDYCKQQLPIISSTHLCAGEMSGQKNACPGDSGGPLAIGKKVIGVVSAGFGCGARNHPGLYTYVGAFRDWIRVNGGV